MRAKVRQLSNSAMPSFLNVPLPLPDELLYSIVARFAQMYSFQSQGWAVRALFGGARMAVSTTLPARISRLEAVANQHWNLTAEAVVDRLTLFRYYEIGLVPELRARYRLHAITDVPSELPKALGIAASSVKHPGHFRYCEACAKQDRKRYGTTYWHRLFQLPGVLLCPEHQLPLRVSKAPLRPQRGAPLIPMAAVFTPQHDRPEHLSDDMLLPAHRFAMACRCILEGAGMEGLPVTSGWLSQALIDRGYVSARSARNELAHELRSFHGANFLMAVDPSGTADGQLPWLDLVWRSPRKQLHPLRLLLLKVFLDASPPPSGAGFGSGPWVCPNWLAPHYGQPVITRSSPVTDRRHPERRIRRFHCDCGMTFTKYESEALDAKAFRIVDFGPLFHDRAKALAAQGCSTHRIARQLGVDWKTARRFLDGATLRKSPATESAEQAWLALTVNNPGEGVKFLRQRNPALYARLYRKRHEWLLAHSPRQRKQTKRRPRVDWKSRDCELSRRMVSAAAKIRADHPEKRITRTALAAALGVQAMLEKNIGQLPECRRVLASVCETRDQYRVRRLHEAAQALGAKAPLWRLIRHASLRSDLISCEIVRKAGLTFKGGD